MWWITGLSWPRSLDPVVHWRNPPGRSELWCEPASKQMSRKRSRWDRRWLISSAQTEWQNAAQMIKSRGGARDEGRDGKFAFSVMRTWQRAGRETLLFHTPKHHFVPPPSVSSLCYQTQITGIICQISWVDACGRVLSLITGFVTGRAGENANNISRASHISEINFEGLFSSSQSVITDWFVFLVISFGGE